MLKHTNKDIRPKFIGIKESIKVYSLMIIVVNYDYKTDYVFLKFSTIITACFPSEFLEDLHFLFSSYFSSYKLSSY
jgi:hypothetical protein